MKFFGWMQNKLTGNCKQGNNVAKPSTTVPSSSFSSHHHKRKNQAREEFSDWPNGLLAIGTFGNNVDIPQPPPPPPPQPREIQDVQDEEGHNIEEEDPSSPDELQDFTPEEIGKLQKELTKLLSRKLDKEKEKEKEKEIDQKNMPLDRFLNCPSTLEVSRRISTAAISETDDKEDDIERTISVILGRCKDIRESKKKKAIGKKSLTFLLKKMFVCRSGFAPQPSLRDTLQESRMEKLLRTLLHKKINTQNAPRAPSMKKYIEDTKEDKEVDKRRNKTTDDGCKWVKTDSEYIVLEI